MTGAVRHILPISLLAWSVLICCSPASQPEGSHNQDVPQEKQDTLKPEEPSDTTTVPGYYKYYEFGKDDVHCLMKMENKYNGHALQAMSIHNSIIFQFYDSGLCRTYDVRDGKLIAEMETGCLIRTNHCGNANFGFEHPAGNSVYPALYISGDLTNKSCYVLNADESSAKLIQTIHFDLDNEYGGSQAVIDNERKRIVYTQRKEKTIGDPDNTFAIYEFRLPALSEGDLTFTEADVLTNYELDTYMPTYQGAIICSGKLWQSYGTGSSGAGYAIFDLKSHRLEKQISVKKVIPKEPQSICRYLDRTLMNFANGELYVLKNVD